MHDHTRLRTFDPADEPAVVVYRVSAGVPFLLTSLKGAHVTVRQITFVFSIKPSGHWGIALSAQFVEAFGVCGYPGFGSD